MVGSNTAEYVPYGKIVFDFFIGHANLPERGLDGLNMLIKSVEELGELIRSRRRETGLTQGQASGFIAVGVRFLGELERGKPTVELGRVLQVLDALGLEVRVQPKGLPR
jgi:HTH-type transcriptional regulator / antitoxin HipB